MSEIIIDFAEPLLKHAKSFEDQRKALEMAIIIWNISMLPKEKQVEQILNFGEDLAGEPTQDSQEVYEVLTYLLARRYSRFPGIHRLVQDFEVLEQPGGFHLNVAHYRVNKKYRKADEKGTGRTRW